jgi:hypothetical protein
MEEDERQLQHIRERDQRDESTPIERGDEDQPESKRGKTKNEERKATAQGPGVEDETPPKPISVVPVDNAALPKSDE